MFRSELVVDFLLVPIRLVKECNNDGDTYDKKMYLSEHDLSKFVYSMNEIS
jgi:hypothetical protein